MMEVNQTQITGGVYLVIDPSVSLELLLPKLKSAISGGVNIVQIWNNWPHELDKLHFISEISNLCKPRNIPVLINENAELLAQTEYVDGVHFDAIPEDISTIRDSVSRAIIIGITCSGNLEIINWANDNQVDYISFCAMFPSSSAGSCEIVSQETVLKAKEMTKIPFFISGGITPQRTNMLKKQIPFIGVAVISGLANAENPEKEVIAYQKALKN